jgi:hypothetical protein
MNLSESIQRDMGWLDQVVKQGRVHSRWTEYLQEAGARARSEGRPRDGQQLLDDRELTLWLEGYDAMDAVICAQLNEIAAGWRTAKLRSPRPCPGQTPGRAAGRAELNRA